MLRKYNIINILFSVKIVFFFGSGCTKFVHVDPPDDRLITPEVFRDENTATASVLAVYNLMSSQSYIISRNCGLLSDELQNYSGSASMIQYYTNSLNAISSTPEPWNSAYNFIYQANAIVSQLTVLNMLNPKVSRQLLGEAYFIRAFWYFYLVNIYGDIPIPLSTDYTKNRLLSRSPASDAYERIIEDLLNAEQMLSPEFVDQSDTVVTVNRVRPTAWAAKSLLARVYLFTKDYKNASLKASEVINQSDKFSLESDLKRVFLANSSEAIWQLAITRPTTINTFDGFNFILMAPPGNGGESNSFTVSSHLLSAFEQGDKRRITWIDSIEFDEMPGQIFRYPFKYRVYQASQVTENVMVLRLAEQYLIRAEANEYLGISADSVLNDLNKLRLRAGLSEFLGGHDQKSILEAILHERQTELFIEWGARWFDLIRTDNVGEILSIITPLKGGIWDGYKKLFPIPQSERNRDPNLTQNAGY